MRELGTALATWLMSRGVTIDVTGAALHTQWAVGQTHSWRPPAIGPHRTEQRSGFRLGQQATSPARQSKKHPMLDTRSVPKRSSWRGGIRRLVAGAVAAGLLNSPS